MVIDEYRSKKIMRASLHAAGIVNLRETIVVNSGKSPGTCLKISSFWGGDENLGAS